MRKRLMLLWCFALVMLCSFWFISEKAFANSNDYLYSSFEGDYYLSKGEDGVSRLKVLEEVIAEFPEQGQNEGICRNIPYVNNSGDAIILPDFSSDKIILSRNGAKELPKSIEKKRGYYTVCTGTDKYLTGTQVYTFEYEYENVVSESFGFQEFRWNANGEGAPQRYNNVTARVHFEEDGMWTGKSWCHVGTNDNVGQGRCLTNIIDDGVEFRANRLVSFESLRFVTQIHSDFFVLPEPIKNYTYVWLLLGICFVCFLCFMVVVKKYSSALEKKHYYEKFLIKPEFRLHGKYDLLELNEIYIGKKNNTIEALLVSMALRKEIEFIEAETTSGYTIKIKDLDGLSEEHASLLSILNDGKELENDSIISFDTVDFSDVEKKFSKAINNGLLNRLRDNHLVEMNYRLGDSFRYDTFNILKRTVFLLLSNIIIVNIMFSLADWLILYTNNDGQIMVFHTESIVLSAGLVILFSILLPMLNGFASRYESHSFEGLKMSKYMDELRLFMKMNETERSKLLEQMKGSKVNPDERQNIYKSLLPYAIIFGFGEKWADEINFYCNCEDNLVSYLIAKRDIIGGKDEKGVLDYKKTNVKKSMDASNGDFSYVHDKRYLN